MHKNRTIPVKYLTEDMFSGLSPLGITLGMN
jgi:hypothetical protein